MKRVGVLVLAGAALVGGALAAAARWAPAAIQPAAARAELTRFISDAVDRVNLGDWAAGELAPVQQVAMRNDEGAGSSESGGSDISGADRPTIATGVAACDVPGYSIATTSGVQVACVDKWVAAPKICLDLASTSTVSGKSGKAGEGPCRVHVVMFSGTREGWLTESRIVRGMGKS